MYSLCFSLSLPSDVARGGEERRGDPQSRAAHPRPLRRPARHAHRLRQANQGPVHSAGAQQLHRQSARPL